MDVAVIGSGFGGLGAAIRLNETGVTNVAIFERAGDLGGTWRDNTYPGSLRRGEQSLLLLLRAQSRLDEHVQLPARDLALPTERGRRVPVARSHQVRPRRTRRLLRRAIEDGAASEPS